MHSHFHCAPSLTFISLPFPTTERSVPGHRLKKVLGTELSITNPSDSLPVNPKLRKINTTCNFNGSVSCCAQLKKF